MLEVSQLTRRYGDFVAVNNVSFSIKPGEIVGLLGHNGAGKTTTMKMLSGFLEPSAGRVQMGEYNLAQEPREIQRQLGYLSENLPIYPDMSVADYLDYAAELKQLRGNHKFAEIRRVVHATDIADKLLAGIHTLSRGYRQRVGVAQALLGKPSLVILDEPTNGLDPTQTEHMRSLIRELSAHATVILSTHIMQEVDALCERVLILSRGELKVDEQLSDLRHGNQILLSTSANINTLQKLLEQLPHIDRLERLGIDGEQRRYRIHLKQTEPLHKHCAAIASAVINSGALVYQLQTESRDLESLFRDVSDSHAINQEAATEKETDHAA